jgi:Tfp pilus assembly protein PilF
MADYYDAIGNNKKAIEYYEKALSLNDFPETRRKYELVRAKK